VFLGVIRVPVFYLKHKTFQRRDSVSAFRWNLLRQNPVAETICVLNKSRTIDNVQKQ
jgi:hypothetical protein